MLNPLSLVLVAALWLSGCATTKTLSQVKPSLPALKSSLFTPVEVPQVEDIFYLTPAQQAAFQNYYFAQERQETAGNVRLFEYLENYVDGFNFHSITLSASQALEHKTGNCLTLAIVTKALADLVGLETGFQRVNSAPVYERVADLMTLSSHVRTYVYEPNSPAIPGLIVFRRASIVIDYFPTSSNVSGNMVDQADFVAMYYQNLAAEALINQQYDRAYALLYQGLGLNYANPETLNTLAVLFNKVGESAQAEKLYRYMLDNDVATANVLTNYAAMLQTQGRVQEVKSLVAKIEKIEDDNPYRWIDLANKAFQGGNYEMAKKYYQKANKLASYLHESQFGLAKSYYQLGQFNFAQQALVQAIAADYRAEHKSLYEAKLHTLLAEKQP